MALLRQVAGYVPFLRWLLPAADEEEEEDEEPGLEPCRVAVVGAGVGGCLAAYFLRQKGGEAVQVDMFERGAVGGRTGTFSFQGHTYETGASIIHSSNKYLVDLSKEFGLETKKDVITVPLGFYDGQKFLFRTGNWKIVNIIRSLWHYGTSLFKMNTAVNRLLKEFVRIYDVQAEGRAFETVPDLLRAMYEEMYQLTQVSAEDYVLRDLGLQEGLVREVITGAMYMNYAQGLNVNASTCMVSLAGVQEESLWSVVGGNRQIPERALERCGAQLHRCSVTSVTRREREGRVSYTLETSEGEGLDDEGAGLVEYDAVIVATPLYEKKIQFNDFPSSVYTEEITGTTYHRTVAEFIDGEINPAFFGCNDNDRSFPLVILTTDSTQNLAPFPFCCAGVNIPSEEPESANTRYTKPLTEERSRVWKLFTPRPLTDEEKGQMFKTINAEATFDWLAYPNYSPPETFPPFRLDQGVFYVNGIEKAASAMEMSAIGAMNCALLARNYLSSRDEA